MKLSKVSLFAGLILGATSIAGIQSPAEAGCYLFGDKSSCGRDISNTGKQIGGSVTKKFKICNETGNTISYSVDGNSSTLRDNYCENWTAPVGKVSFDWSYRSGYQGESYTLTHGRKYAFQKGNIRNGFDLYKK